MSHPAPYPKTARLRRPGEFRRVLAEAAVYPGREVLVRRAPSPAEGARLGISTPRRYGNSVRRNRLRRLIREAFRTLRVDLGTFDFFVSPRKHLVEPSLEGIKRDLFATLTRAPIPRRTPGRRK